jgi:hypothetical protein
MSYKLDLSSMTYIQLPVIEVTVISVDTVNPNDTMTVENILTGETLVLNRVFSAGDVIKFDSSQEKTFVNDEETAAFGTYPSLLPVNNNELDITTTFSGGLISTEVTVTERFV